MEVKKDILWRVYLCFLGMIGIGAMVLGRAFYIQRIEGRKWKNMGDSLHQVFRPVEAERGTIYSEDGNMLSSSVPVFDVSIDFRADGLMANDGKLFKDNIDSLSICLAGLFRDKTPDDYKKELQLEFKNGDRNYIFKKRISFVERQQLKTFPLIRLEKYKSGFKIESKDKRINPYGLFANRTLGLSREEPGKNVGLERSYDSLLRGTRGQRLMRYVAGNYIPVEGVEMEAVNGKDLVTTLDTYIQDITEKALMKMLVNNNSTHGSVIVMETSTGKIKAIANLGKQKDGSYGEDLNYGVGMATEPGSIFKLATLLSLLEDKFINSGSIVDCEGGSRLFYGLHIKDAHAGTGPISVLNAFAQSSNVAFAKLADQFYHAQPSRFIAHLHDLRLDTLTGIDITASSGKPTIKRPASRTWSATTIPFMAHGYEEMVTPLHMLMLYNAVANNGKMMKPYLVNAIKEFGTEIKTFHPQVLVEKICSDETLIQLKECLRAVVDSVHGTAHKVVFDSTYAIAGKTGTAVTALNNKGYNKGNKIYQASFIGYFPAGLPKYTIAVVIQNSIESKLIYGADVSGAVFKEISDRIYGHILGKNKFIAPVKTDSMVYNYYGMMNELGSIFNWMNIQHIDSASSGLWRGMLVRNNQAFLSTPGFQPTGNIIPEVNGLGLKDAIYLLENMGLNVRIKGRGRVVNQSPGAGTIFKKGQSISIILN